MKTFLLSLSISLVSFSAISSFYAIKFDALDGGLIKTTSYQGEKVLIAVVSANSAGVTLLHYLDSLQKNTANLQVIAIPTDDLGGNINVQDLRDLKKNLSIEMTKPLKVKKASSAYQHPLFQWLTRAKENGHFDMDVKAEGQVFIVSQKGTLYAVLPKEAPASVIAKVINQPFNE